jgi:Na+-driven multidrug efflux pump
MRIWYFGMIFVIVPMVGNSTIRATGDSRTPGLIMIAGALINTGLDPLLIFGPGVFPALGISGAALATLIGRSSTFCVALFVLIRRERLITFEKPLFREMTASWGEILYIGLPNAGTKMIVPLGVGAVTRILAGSGMAAVAGYGIGSRLEFFSLAAVNALSTIFGPFIGQNIGAGKLGRVSEGFRKAELFSFALGGSFFLIYLFSGRIIASVFSDDPEVVSTAALYIRVVAAAYGLQGFYMITASGLNVLKRPFHAAGLSLLEMFGLIIPLGLLGSVLYGVSGVFIAIAVSYAITGLVSRRVLTGVLAAA